MVTETWPTDLLDFAFIPAMDDKLRNLSEMAEAEDWDYHNTSSDHMLPILYNYLRYTYRRIAEENKITISRDGQLACFNTGLVTEHQEAIFAYFEVHREDNRQPWYLKGWLRKGQWELNRFDELPDIAHYFDDPSCLVFDTNKEIRPNIEHIIENNKERFHEPYKSMDNHQLQTFLKGAIDNAKERVRRSYKTAIPQYYNGHVQLLFPLCLTSPSKADLALVIGVC